MIHGTADCTNIEYGGGTYLQVQQYIDISYDVIKKIQGGCVCCLLCDITRANLSAQFSIDHLHHKLFLEALEVSESEG